MSATQPEGGTGRPSPEAAGIGGLLGVVGGLAIAVGIAGLMIGIFNWVG